MPGWALFVFLGLRTHGGGEARRAGFRSAQTIMFLTHERTDELTRRETALRRYGVDEPQLVGADAEV